MKYSLNLILLTIFTAMSANAQIINLKDFFKNVQKYDSQRLNIPINKVSSDLLYLHNNLTNIDTSSKQRIINNAISTEPISKQSIQYVNCFIQMENLKHIEELKMMGVIFNETNPSKNAGCRIPINKIELVSKLEYVLNIEDSKLTKQNDYISRIQSKTDSVYSGYQLPSKYFGKNVIIGIIDAGFDFTHPNFYDSTGINYRVSRVWNQNDTSGKKPLGFTYGSEYITKQEILTKRTDDSTAIHGTHVTGLAAGSGYGITNTFKGISSESDICLVSTTFYQNNLLDAIKYLINYAKLQNKPISINLSLGSQAGPRDGTSIFNRTVDSLIEDGNSKGVIITFSAGNEGAAIIHNNVVLSPINKDSIRFAFIKGYNHKIIPDDLKKYDANNNLSVEIWGDINKELFIHTGLYNLKTNKYENSLNNFVNSSKSGNLVDTSFTYKGIKIPIKIINGSINPSTKKPNSKLLIGGFEYQVLYNLDTNLVIAIAYYSFDNNINSWITSPSDYGVNSPSFLNYFGNNQIIVNGDNNMTLVDESSGKSVITVGAVSSYLGNNIISNQIDTLHKIANFSSLGYTSDGRIKPDIAASGNRVISSLNSWKTFSTNDKNNYQPYYVNFNNKAYPYGLNQGTSMAAPVVTGVIGLWLEAYPRLASNQIKEIFKNATIKDRYTGTNPNKYYGYGKIDAYNGLKYLLNQIPEKPILSIQKDTSICQNETISIKTNNLYKSYKWYKNGQVVATTQILNITSSGYYSIEVEGQNGYFSKITDSIKISINPIPQTPTIQRENNYLTSTGTGSFQWYKDGVILNDSISQKMKPSSAGLYTVKNINNNCSSQISQSYYYVNVVTDIINISSNEFIKISPNPVKDLLFVNFKLNGYYKIDIDVFELSSGRILKKFVNVESGSLINLGGLSSSTLLVRVSSNDSKFNYQFKIIKL